MGSCLGYCRLARESFRLYRFYSKTRGNVDIHVSGLATAESEEHIMDDSFSRSELNCEPKFEPKKPNFKRLKSIFSNIRNKPHNGSSLKLELLDDDEWSVTDGDDFSARTQGFAIPSGDRMIEEKSHNSASVNSLDLEWEHLPEMTVFSSKVEKEEPKSATSGGGWSKLSSADSLEWDPAEVEMKEDTDAETEQLLQEIEMLSSKTLQETQEWAS